MPIVSEPARWDLVWARGRTSLRARLERLQRKAFHVLQASLAAGVAWFVATELFDHRTPFFAPIAAVVCLGTSFSQRHRRVLEVTMGVAIGVLVADLLVLAFGTGWWQLSFIVALAMGTALLLNPGGLFVTQAAVQSIVVATLVPEPGQALLRWTDALIGGGVALVAATVVPAAPLRRPREQAAHVLETMSSLLRGAARGIVSRDTDAMLELLSDARATELLVDELRVAADEGMSVVISSPFRLRHRGAVRKVAELVEPLDLALRNTRVLVRRTAVAAYRGDVLPAAYAPLCEGLADAAAEVAAELRADRMAVAVRPHLVRLGERTSVVTRTADLSGEVVLAQLRSIIADLLRVTGLGPLESTDAIPPLRG